MHCVADIIHVYSEEIMKIGMDQYMSACSGPEEMVASAGVSLVQPQGRSPTGAAGGNAVAGLTAQGSLRHTPAFDNMITSYPRLIPHCLASLGTCWVPTLPMCGCASFVTYFLCLYQAFGSTSL